MTAAPRLQVPPNSDLTLGMVCVDKSVPGRTTWTMRADERFANPAGIMQGGLLGAFADSAMGAAAVTWARGRPVQVANAEMKVSFLAPVACGSALTCEAVVVSGGARVAFVEAGIWALPPAPIPPAPVPAPVPAEVEPMRGLVARASSTYLIRDRG